MTKDDIIDGMNKLFGDGRVTDINYLKPNATDDGIEMFKLDGRWHMVKYAPDHIKIWIEGKIKQWKVSNDTTG